MTAVGTSGRSSESQDVAVTFFLAFLAGGSGIGVLSESELGGFVCVIAFDDDAISDFELLNVKTALLPNRPHLRRNQPARFFTSFAASCKTGLFLEDSLGGGGLLSVLRATEPAELLIDVGDSARCNALEQLLTLCTTPRWRDCPGPETCSRYDGWRARHLGSSLHCVGPVFRDFLAVVVPVSRQLLHLQRFAVR
jgi:hypothetical protein